MITSIKLPSFYYQGRAKEFDQKAYTDWYNNLCGIYGEAIMSQRSNTIMKKYVLNTLYHLRKYLKERIYEFDDVFDWEKDVVPF